MTETLILDRLRSNSLIFDNVSSRLDSLVRLLGSDGNAKIDISDCGFTYNDVMELTTLYQTEDATISYVEFKEKGASWPEHLHTNSVQFIMVSRGSFLFHNHTDVRTMGKGDFTAILMGEGHSFESLEDGSILISVCIPPEKAYLVESAKCPKSQEKSL